MHGARGAAGSATTDDQLSLSLGQPGGGFGPPRLLAKGTRSVQLAQLREPGVFDLVVLGRDDSLWLLPGDSRGEFGAMAPLPLGAAAQVLGLADLDADGVTDVVVESAGKPQLLASLQGFAATPLPLVLPEGTRKLSAADTDGDGNPELMLNSPAGVSIYALDVDAWIMTSAVRGDLVEARDLDGDSHVDLLLNHDAAKRVQVRRGDGRGNFDAGAELAGQVFAVGDADQGGQLDLMVSHDRAQRLFRGQSDGTFLAGPPIAIRDAPSVGRFVSTATGTQLVYAFDGRLRRVKAAWSALGQPLENQGSWPRCARAELESEEDALFDRFCELG